MYQEREQAMYREPGEARIGAKASNITSQLDDAEKSICALRDELEQLVQQYAPVLLSNGMNDKSPKNLQTTMSPLALRIETLVVVANHARSFVRILKEQSDL